MRNLKALINTSYLLAIIAASTFTLYGSDGLAKEEKNPLKGKVQVTEFIQLQGEAETYFAEGSYKKARSKYNQMIKLAPDHPGGFLGIGRLYLLEGNNEKALENLTQASKLAPQSSDVHGQ